VRIELILKAMLLKLRGFKVEECTVSSKYAYPTELKKHMYI
jgi:hypothetical protein